MNTLKIFLAENYMKISKITYSDLNYFKEMNGRFPGLEFEIEEKINGSLQVTAISKTEYGYKSLYQLLYELSDMYSIELS